jgi:hypothetical protein
VRSLPGYGTSTASPPDSASGDPWWTPRSPRRSRTASRSLRVPTARHRASKPARAAARSGSRRRASCSPLCGWRAAAGAYRAVKLLAGRFTGIGRRYAQLDESLRGAAHSGEPGLRDGDRPALAAHGAGPVPPARPPPRLVRRALPALADRHTLRNLLSRPRPDQWPGGFGASRPRAVVGPASPRVMDQAGPSANSSQA